jgi:hypothetical protein
MSWPGGSAQPQQARLAQALRDFGDGTDQAVRAWAGQLTMRQALDITYVITDILRLLETTTERLSRYRAGSEPAQGYNAGPDQPNEEIAQARASIGSARAALVHPFQEAYRAAGGWPDLGGDPARDGTAVFLAHLLYQRLTIVDEPWPGLSRDAPEPMQTGLTEAVAHLDDTFGHLRGFLICSAKRDIGASDAEELDRRLRLAIPLPGRAQALRTKNARSAALAARIAAADFPYSAAGSAAMRSPAMAATADLAAAPLRQSRRSRSKENNGHHQ